MRVDHFLAAVPQMISMYLVLCIMGNWLSMLAPMPIASGSLKPSNPKLVPILIQLVFLLLLAIAMLPMLLPVGIELLLDYLEIVQGMPICLLLSLLECVAVFFIYRICLTSQGSLLQSREQQILQIVTTKAE
jgi:ABC-2 type transport system permease protein